MSGWIHTLNEWVWNPGLVVLLMVAGLYFSCRTRFVQVRRFRSMVKSLFSWKTGAKGISSFEAFCLALSGRVGTGNIVGVATAIAFGGPGAVLWMWVVAFFGASTAFVEATLAQRYKMPHSSGFRGGPFAFIEQGLHQGWLATLFALVTVIACGLFLPTVQSNGASSALQNAFGVPEWISGVGLVVILGMVIVGGVRRIAKVASVVTPIMAVIYLLMALIVICVHWEAVPEAFGAIFRGAFGLEPVTGGIIGTTVAMGVRRGVYSNEAGQGSGAIVSAAADVPYPAQQGLAQAFSVYVDTLLVCTATALMILTSGTYNIIDASGHLLYAGAPELGNNYVNYTQSAVDTVFAGFGSHFVALSMIFFVFTTLMAYYFYAESSLIYLYRKHPSREKRAIRVYQVLMLGSIVFGAMNEADVVWQLGDIGVGSMAWITVISLLILCPQAIQELKWFENRVDGE